MGLVYAAIIFEPTQSDRKSGTRVAAPTTSRQHVSRSRTDLAILMQGRVEGLTRWGVNLLTRQRGTSIAESIACKSTVIQKQNSTIYLILSFFLFLFLSIA